jgi:hypothetical protein
MDKPNIYNSLLILRNQKLLTSKKLSGLRKDLRYIPKIKELPSIQEYTYVIHKYLLSEHAIFHKDLDVFLNFKDLREFRFVMTK